LLRSSNAASNEASDSSTSSPTPAI
jgi:hypothetical protein